MGANAADLIIAAVVLLSGLWALWRGFVREVLGIIGWVGAALATLYGFSTVRPYARELIAIDLVADVAAGLTLFIATLILLSLLSSAISSSVRGSALGALDRSLGFLFGLARGFVVVCLAYLVLGWAIPQPADRPAWITGARTLPLIERGAQMLAGLLPADARERGAQAAERTRQEAQRATEATRALEQLMAPPARGDAPREGANGYSDTDRKQLDRLFQGK